ncbi:MAG: hypothetical protein PHI06_13345 [Desulfobulbaceae bacterium]|nr:hypothetical protein [Desulfobulbaceae bacterium]
MTPKKVWGIILIILGLLAIFKGASDIQQVEDFNTMMNFLGVGQVLSGNQLPGLNLEEVKRDASLGISLGIGMAIIGTLMLKDTTTKKGKRIISDEVSLANEPIIASDDKYACSVKESVGLSPSFGDNVKIATLEKPRIIDMRTGKEEPTDDERWMHPSMRGKKN